MAGNCEYLAARLKHRVTLQTRSRSSDSQGGYTESWADTATLRAEITPLKGYERMQAMKIGTPLTHKVMLRYNPSLNITANMRLLFGTRALDIKEVINLEEANQYLRLMCVETN